MWFMNLNIRRKTIKTNKEVKQEENNNNKKKNFHKKIDYKWKKKSQEKFNIVRKQI